MTGRTALGRPRTHRSRADEVASSASGLGEHAVEANRVEVPQIATGGGTDCVLSLCPNGAWSLDPIDLQFAPRFRLDETDGRRRGRTGLGWVHRSARRRTL